MSFKRLVEVTRNNLIESQHFGAVSVRNHQGKTIESWGDPNHLIFPRSAIKPFLAIQLIESGAFERYALSDAELAIACSSHLGELIHLNVIISWLARIGLEEINLACGASLPEHETSAQFLLKNGQKPGRIHHTCSGKHLGYLTTALHLNTPLNNYHLFNHPTQKMAFDILSDLSNTDVSQLPMGIDGCGLPAPMMSLSQLALATAKFANPENVNQTRQTAIHQIQSAINNEPLFLSGHHSLVSDINMITNGKIIAKSGAEGVFIAAIPKFGLGIALKMADGSNRASSVALLSILNHLNLLSTNEQEKLKSYIRPTLLNSRKEIIGEIRPAAIT